MAGRQIDAFSMEDLRRWEQAFEANAPKATNDVKLNDLPRVISLRQSNSRSGIGLTLRLSDGTEPQFFMNPVVARAVAIAIMNAGRLDGWLPDIMTVAIPQIDPKDRLDG
jgi:hypothetical protein